MNRHHIMLRNMAGHYRAKFKQIMRRALRDARRDLRSDDPGLTVRDVFDRSLMALTDHMIQTLRQEEQRVEKGVSTYAPLFSMPPARRKPAVPGKPLTLVERRAVAAKRKVVEWQRKQKLAATKVKSYRRKVSYYTKKGVIR